MLIKYLDQKLVTGKFQDLEQIKAIKNGVVEAVGYLIKEDETGYLLASTINGGGYNGLLFVPRQVVAEVDPDYTGIEVNYYEVQGISRLVSKDKLATLPLPPVVRLCGFEAYRSEDTVYIAQEKNEAGNFRTITAIPIKYLV